MTFCEHRCGKLGVIAYRKYYRSTTSVTPNLGLKPWFNMSEKLCLNWNDFQENVNAAFGSLRGDHDQSVTFRFRNFSVSKLLPNL